MDKYWYLADLAITIGLLVILWQLYRWHFRMPTRRVWRCYRFFGGGAIDTPKPMTITEATHWLGSIQGEVSHVDHEHGFIFYRPRGG